MTHSLRLLLIPLLLLCLSVDLRAQGIQVNLFAPEKVIAGEYFEISVEIAKGSNTSFARIQLIMPAAFKTDSLDGDSARFSQEEFKVKYIWDRMPRKETLLVKFKIHTDAELTGLLPISGLFTYITDETKKEIEIPTKVIAIQPPLLASTPEEVTPEVERQDEEPVETESKVKTEVSAAPPVVEEEVVIEQEPDVKEITSAPVAPSNQGKIIEFRIQMIASKTKVNIETLKSKYNIAEGIQSEMHNGLWKYTVGSFRSYSEAKNKIPYFQNEKKIVGAFVTAYQGGERISVRTAIIQTK